MTQEMRDMKKLLMALTLATLATSSALAKTQHSQSPAAAAADPYTVIVNGEAVGRDPDPNVRFELLRDPGLPAS
jgi:hypothetical protein